MLTVCKTIRKVNPIRPWAVLVLSTPVPNLLLMLQRLPAHFYNRDNHFFQAYTAMLKSILVIVYVVIVVIGIT